MKDLKDGIYQATVSNGGKYRVDIIDGVPYFADGTGWLEKVAFPEEIVSIENIDHLSDMPENAEDWAKYKCIHGIRKGGDCRNCPNLVKKEEKK